MGCAKAGIDVMDEAGHRFRTRRSPRSSRTGRSEGADHDADRDRLPLGERRLAARAGLFACVRPCKSYPGVRSRYDNVDLVVVRENTEDLYAGIEYESGSAEAVKAIAP